MQRFAARVLEVARLTSNFHPDRLCVDGRSVMRALAEDGVYRSQFVTKISNGGLSAHPGGPRFRWESRMFAGAYDDAPGVERPVYGGLDVWHHPDGASPRFGSCAFVWDTAVMERATFSWQDSVTDPEHMGTHDAFEDVASQLLESLAGGSALGMELELEDAVGAIDSGVLPPSRGRALDDYIEAQVHGALTLQMVEALIIDPSFTRSPVFEDMAQAASAYGFEIVEHAGFVLEPEDVPGELRGAHIPEFARWVAERFAGGGGLDAETIGRAAVDIVRHPEAWEEWGDQADVLQWVKYVWHILVLRGRPHD